jgi:hypothetical protein
MDPSTTQSTEYDLEVGTVGGGPEAIVDSVDTETRLESDGDAASLAAVDGPRPELEAR